MLLRLLLSASTVLAFASYDSPEVEDAYRLLEFQCKGTGALSRCFRDAHEYFQLRCRVGHNLFVERCKVKTTNLELFKAWISTSWAWHLSFLGCLDRSEREKRSAWNRTSESLFQHRSRVADCEQTAELMMDECVSRAMDQNDPAYCPSFGRCMQTYNPLLKVKRSLEGVYESFIEKCAEDLRDKH